MGKDGLAEIGVLRAVAGLQGQKVRSPLGQQHQGLSHGLGVIAGRVAPWRQREQHVGVQVEERVQVPACLLGVVFRRGELGFRVQLDREIGRGRLKSHIAALQRPIGPQIAIAGEVAHAAQEGGACLRGQRRLDELAGLLGDTPLRPEQIEIGLLGGKSGCPSKVRARQQGGHVDAGRDIVRSLGVRPGHRFVDAGGDLRVGQQPGGEHLRLLDPDSPAPGFQVGVVQHGENRRLSGGDSITGVDADGLQGLQAQPSCVHA